MINLMGRLTKTGNVQAVLHVLTTHADTAFAEVTWSLYHSDQTAWSQCSLACLQIQVCLLCDCGIVVLSCFVQALLANRSSHGGISWTPFA